MSDKQNSYFVSRRKREFAKLVLGLVFYLLKILKAILDLIH
jgi:hypothetical protein